MQPYDSSNFYDVFFSAFEAGDMDTMAAIMAEPCYSSYLPLSSALEIACENGNLPMVEFLVSSPKLKPEQRVIIKKYSDILPKAATNGHLDIVEYLMKCTTSKEYCYSQNHITESVRAAAGKGHLDIVKFFVYTPDVYTNPKYMNPLFTLLCQHGLIDIVDQLLTTPGLKEHVDIHHTMDEPLIASATQKNPAILKYLLSNYEFSKNSITTALRESCIEGNESTIKYLLMHGNIKKNIGIAMYQACLNDTFSIVKSILDDAQLREHADIHQQEDYLLKKVVEKGNLDMVDYLLTNLNEKYEYIDEAFIQAMQGDQPDMVYYLLTSPQFQEQTDKNNNNTDALIWAAKNEHLDLIYQILDNKDLTVNIHSKYEATFRNLYQNQQIEPIKKLIFEYDLSVTPQISDILMEGNGITDQVLTSFERRECNYTLSQNLSIGNKINKARKI